MGIQSRDVWITSDLWSTELHEFPLSRTVVRSQCQQISSLRFSGAWRLTAKVTDLVPLDLRMPLITTCSVSLYVVSFGPSAVKVSRLRTRVSENSRVSKIRNISTLCIHTLFLVVSITSSVGDAVFQSRGREGTQRCSTASRDS